MSGETPDYDEMFVPMVARLVKSLRIRPSPEETEELKNFRDVKELARLFDQGSKFSDRELYEKLLETIYEKRNAAKKAEEEAKRLEREEANRAAREAEAAQKKAEEEERRKEEEARYDAEMAKKCPGKCLHCKKWIQDKNFLQNDDEFLHNDCLDAYQKGTSPPCHQCGDLLTGEYVILTAAGTNEEVYLHPDCVMPYKKATRPNCKKCGEQILDKAMSVLNGEHYHPGCV